MTKERRKVTLNLLRGAKGKRQQDIVDVLKQLGRNVDQQLVSKWERGVMTPTIATAIDLAVAYDVSFIEIVKALGFEPELDRLHLRMDKDKVMQA